MALNKDSNNIFYVYEWYNKDTGEVFYVGKGKNGVHKSIKNRNQYFLNYHNKHNCEVRKVYTGLSESEAFEKEVHLIGEYKQLAQCKCNLTIGGEGSTFEEDSREYWISKLNCMYNALGKMDAMPNYLDYESENLKTKTKEELKKMYEEVLIYNSNIKTARQFGLMKNITLKEVKVSNSEVFMLFNIILTNIVNNNREFCNLPNCKSDSDFFKYNINFNKLLNLIKNDYQFINQLLISIDKTLKFIWGNYFGEQYELKSFNIEKDYITLKLKNNSDKQILNIKIEIDNVIINMITKKYDDFIGILNCEIMHGELI